MNGKFALILAVQALAVSFVTVYILSGSQLDTAIFCAGVVAAIMGLLGLYVSREHQELVPGATPPQAADAALSMFGGTQRLNADGSITVRTGYSHSWLEFHAAPDPGGVVLRGYYSDVYYVKRKLTGG